jgi:benzil reductase ((S)-benzoin forming)
VERFGTLDLWINNAGILPPIAPLREITSNEYRRHIEVNVLGVFSGASAFVRHRRLLGQGGGVLVNISSGAGRNGYAGWSAYCAAKAAVDLMTECVSLEERGTGLRAYALAPGVIDTQMQELIRNSTPEQFPTVEKFRQLKANQAFHTPEWVAERILELAFGDWRPTEVRLDLRR